MSKFRTLMRALGERGDDVRVINVDAAYPASLAAGPQIDTSGFPSARLPPSAYDPNAHWLRQILQRSHIERAFAQVLDNIQADVLVFGIDSFVSGRAFVRVSKVRGIVTLLIPDGLVVPQNESFRQSLYEHLRDLIAERIQQAFRGGGPRGLSGIDGILVINRMGAEVLRQQGIDPRIIHVVGSPEYDELARAMHSGGCEARVATIRARLGAPDGRPLLMFAHQTLDGSEKALVRTMVFAAKRCDAVVVVKFHPRGRENPAQWRLWARDEGLAPEEVMFVSDECTTIEILQASAACVTAYSTVSLECLVVGCPLIVVRYANVPYALPYGEKYGAALEAHSPAELETAIAAVLRDEGVRVSLERGRAAAIRYELGNLDGHSVERAIAAIEKTVARVRAGLQQRV